MEPVVAESVVRKKISETYSDKRGRQRLYELPELTMYKVYCRVCREERAADGARTKKFGVGYKSGSEADAVKKWNNACMTEKLRLFKKAVMTGNGCN